MKQTGKTGTPFIGMYPYIVILIFLACGSVSVNDRREGFIEDGFRIYVRLESHEIPDTMTDEQIDKVLVEKGKERFSQLAFAFKEVSGIVIPEIQNGKIVYPSCSIVIKKENYENVEGFVDFSVSREFKDAYIRSYPPLKKEDDE